MHVWREVFYRLEQWADRLESGGRQVPGGQRPSTPHRLPWASGSESCGQERTTMITLSAPTPSPPRRPPASCPGRREVEAQQYPPWEPGEDRQLSPAWTRRSLRTRGSSSTTWRTTARWAAPGVLAVSDPEPRWNGPAKGRVGVQAGLGEELGGVQEGVSAVQRGHAVPGGHPAGAGPAASRASRSTSSCGASGDLYQTLHVDGAEEEEIIQYVVGTLQPKLQAFPKALPKTLEQLIQERAWRCRRAPAWKRAAGAHPHPAR